MSRKTRLVTKYIWIVKLTVVAPLKSTPMGTARLMVRPVAFIKASEGHEPDAKSLPLKSLPAHQKKLIPKSQHVQVPLLAQVTSDQWHVSDIDIGDIGGVGHFKYKDRVRLLTLYAAQIQALLNLLHQEISRSLSDEVWQAHRSALQNPLSQSQLQGLSSYLYGRFMSGQYKNHTFCLTFTPFFTYPVQLADKDFQTLQTSNRNDHLLEVTSQSQHVQKLFESIWSVIRTVIQPDRTMVVWRAYTPVKPLPRVGSYVPHPSFLSTTLVKSFAIHWLRGSSCCLWRLEVNPSEVPGLFISNHLAGGGNNLQQFEWLVAPCYLRIIRVEPVSWDLLMNEQDQILFQTMNSNVEHPPEITLVHAQVVPAKKMTWKGACLTLSPPTR